MRWRENEYREKVKALIASYETLGREALAKMSNAECHALHAEKAVDLRAAQAHLRQFPHDELGQLRHQKAARESSDIAGYLKAVAEKERKWRDHDLDMG